MTALGRMLAGSLAALLAACSPQAADGASAAAGVAEANVAQANVAQASIAQNGAAKAVQTHPVSGLEIIPVTITRADGTAHIILAENAVDEADQARGLMFRSEMGADEGMLFDYEDTPRVLSFWMRNTYIPLDLVFIDGDRRVLNIVANAQPYSEDQIYSDGIAIGVLELNGGRAQELQIAPGDTLEW